jgi:Putative beta-barrel porin 2
MKKISLIINNRHRRGPSWPNASLLSLVSVFFCAAVPLFADATDAGSGGGTGFAATQSGTYSTPTATLVPTTSAGNAPTTGQGGRLPFLVSASISEVYDDNIFIQPHKTSDFITQLNVRGEYSVGDRSASDGNYLDVFYAPSGDIYARNSSQDSFNQAAGLLYQHRFSKLTLGVEQDYSKDNSTSASAGNLVTSSLYTTNAWADFDYSDKLTLLGDFTQTVTDYETTGYASSNEWSGNFHFLYHLDSKISVGLGPRFGFLDITGAPNQTYQQLLAWLTYGYSDKLSFTLSGGAEYREYQNSNPGDKLSPVFNLAGVYTPSSYTTLTLSAGRQYNPSYNFTGQNYINTNVTLTGREKFCRDFHYNLSFGYENDDYESAGAVITGNTRNDNYYFVNTGFDWNPNSWLLTSIYYKYQKDDSNFASSTFDDNQVGLSLSVSY